MVGLSIRHKICARNNITLDWVIKNRPAWLKEIKRVRHRYTDQGKAAARAQLRGVAADKTASSPVPGMPHGIYEYHASKGHISAGQEKSVGASQVVRVSYGRSEQYDHLVGLLEPMFDFETLQKIDSPLVNRIARDLKWPVMDRLKESANMVKELALPAFEAKLVQAVSTEQATENIRPRLSQAPPANTLLVIAIDKTVNKAEIRDVAFRYGLACQFMLSDHAPKTYSVNYYGNLVAGVFSKAGGLICGVGEMPGDVDLFIGLNMGGVSQRAPGLAFLFTRNGAQLGWQLAVLQAGERLDNDALESLLRKSIQAYDRHYNAPPP